MSPAREPGSVARRIPVALGLAAVLGFHLFICIHYAKAGEMGADEGFYAVAARSAMEGKLPYRDFAYTQMPLLPYLNGAAMTVAGFSMDSQRMINVAWSTIGLVALVLAIRQRLGRWEPAIAAAFVACASPHWAALQGIGTSHGPAGMFLALSAAAVLSTSDHRKRVWALAAFSALAVGCRLLAAPPILFLIAALALQADGRGERIRSAAIPLGAMALANLPFFLAAPSNACYDVWTYHVGSSLDRRSIGNWVEWWRTGPAAIMVLVAGLTTAVAHLKRRNWTELLLLGAALAGVLVPMLPRSAYGLYIAPAVPLAAAAGIVAAWSLLEGRPSPFRHIVWLLPLVVLYYDLPPTDDEGASAQIRELAEFVEAEAPEGPVLTPIPIVAVEAKREVLPGTEMGMFAVMASRRAERARRLKLTTLPELTRAVEERVPAAVVLRRGRSPWNFAWINPTLRLQPRREIADLVRAIHKGYGKGFTNRDGVVWVREDL